MSGMRGAPRKANTKIRVQIRFTDTGKAVTTNVFVRKSATAVSILEKVERKYGKTVELIKAYDKKAFREIANVSSAMAIKAC